MKPEIIEIQSWHYKTIVVIKRQQQTTISNKHAASAELRRLHSYFVKRSMSESILEMLP